MSGLEGAAVGIVAQGAQHTSGRYGVSASTYGRTNGFGLVCGLGVLQCGNKLFTVLSKVTLFGFKVMQKSIKMYLCGFQPVSQRPQRRIDSAFGQCGIVRSSTSASFAPPTAVVRRTGIG